MSQGSLAAATQLFLLDTSVIIHLPGAYQRGPGGLPLHGQPRFPAGLGPRQESVRRFIELAALELGWGALEWQGTGTQEVGRRGTGEVVVRIDPRYFRPAEVETLLGDPSKAHEKLGWSPTTTLEELVAEMVTHDKEEARKEAILRLKGFNVVGAREG